MKVIYFIFVSAGGKGGHFHSLNHITQEIGNKNPSIRIITIGRETSPILNHNPFFYKHLYFSKTKFFSFYLKLYKEIKSFNPELLHFFDAHSYNVFFPISFFVKKYIVVNKCGGPNPNNYPIVPNLILFSEENLRWFLSRKQYNNTNIKVIPNRVTKINIIEHPEYIKDSSVFTFIRICRIGKTYYNSILNGINLIKELTGRGIKVKLIIIGKVIDESEYNSLIKISDGLNVEFIIDEDVTSEASNMLYLADAVIGTGRSAMESCSLGLPTLIPSKHYNFPILLTKSNFTNYFENNFTDRVSINDRDEQDVLTEITKLIFDKEYYNVISAFSIDVFYNYFDLEQASLLYLDFYQNLKPYKVYYKMIKINSTRTLSTIYRVFKRHF